jgi:periplasmic protein TonB
MVARVPRIDPPNIDPVAPAADRPAPDVPAFGNVVPFARRAARDPEPADARSFILAIERCVPALPDDRGRAWIALLVGTSLLIHGGLLAWLTRAPQPLPGIDLPAISVDIVFADSVPAASAPAPGPPAKDQQPPSQAPDPTPPPETTQPAAQEPESKPAEQPPPVVSRTQPAEPAPRQQTDEPQPVQQAPDAVPSAPPKDQPARKPIEEKAASAPPPKPKPRAEDKPTQHATISEQKAAPGARPTATSSARAPARADPNYLGMVVAHLGRYKQVLTESGNSHSQAVAMVSVSIDGSGRVTAVRLARTTGVPSWDREAQALPRRASPFPPPPDGHPMSFNAPLSFGVR